MKYAFIYLLVFPLHDMFKIGKANDVDSRVATLKAEWGRLDADRSFTMRVNADEVFSLENALHATLTPFKKPLIEGDGHNEMFHLTGFDSAVHFLRQQPAMLRGMTLRAERRLNNDASYDSVAQSLFSELHEQGETVCTHFCEWINRIANTHNNPSRPACFDVTGTRKMAITIPRRYSPQTDQLPYSGFIPSVLRHESEQVDIASAPHLSLLSRIAPYKDFTTLVFDLDSRKQHDKLAPYLKAIEGIIRTKLPRNQSHYHVKMALR